jgi:DNA-binding NarL/FixJ family response regulator
MDLLLSGIAIGALLCAAAALTLSTARRSVSYDVRGDAGRLVESMVRLLRLRWLAMESVARGEIDGELRRAASGDSELSPWLARFALDTLIHAASPEPGAPIDPEPDAPTAWEREILLLIASGYAYEQIAERLRVSITAIVGHVSSVLRKLEIVDAGE